MTYVCMSFVCTCGLGRHLNILIEKRKSECAKNHREVGYPNIRVQTNMVLAVCTHAVSTVFSPKTQYALMFFGFFFNRCHTKIRAPCLSSLCSRGLQYGTVSEHDMSCNLNVNHAPD